MTDQMRSCELFDLDQIQRCRGERKYTSHGLELQHILFYSTVQICTNTLASSSIFCVLGVGFSMERCPRLSGSDNLMSCVTIIVSVPSKHRTTSSWARC